MEKKVKDGQFFVSFIPFILLFCKMKIKYLHLLHLLKYAGEVKL